MREQLAGAATLPELEEIVSHAARELGHADGATFVLRDGSECFYVEEDAIGDLWKGQRFPMASCISGWSMIYRRAAVIEDIYIDHRIPHDAYRSTFVKSLAMVPINRREPVGAIGVYWAERHLPSLDEVEVIEQLAGSTAEAMKRLEPTNGASSLAT